MFSERLSKLRAEHKKIHQQMADMLGITRQAYGNYENGSREPDFNTLEKLADYFGVSVDFLLGKTDDPTPADQLTSQLTKAAEAAKFAKSSREQTSTYDIDPGINVFFKDFASAPKEKQEEMIRFWNYIREQEKGRKSGDKQGE